MILTSGAQFIETGPNSSVLTIVGGSVQATGGHGFDLRQRHIKVVKNDTSCSSLGTQIYRAELGLLDPVSG